MLLLTVGVSSNMASFFRHTIGPTVSLVLQSWQLYFAMLVSWAYLEASNIQTAIGPARRLSQV